MEKSKLVRGLTGCKSCFGDLWTYHYIGKQHIIEDEWKWFVCTCVPNHLREEVAKRGHNKGQAL